MCTLELFVLLLALGMELWPNVSELGPAWGLYSLSLWSNKTMKNDGQSSHVLPKMTYFSFVFSEPYSLG